MKALLACCSILLLLVLGTAAVRAGLQSGYSLDWWAVPGGGITFTTGGGYSLGGTTGQADAGVLAGGLYTLGGGFWRGGAPSGEPGTELYLPLILKDG